MKKILVIVLAAYVFSPMVYLGNIEPAYATPKAKPGKKKQNEVNKKDESCANDMIICADVCGMTTSPGTKTRDNCTTKCATDNTACRKQ